MKNAIKSQQQLNHY